MHHEKPRRFIPVMAAACVVVMALGLSPGTAAFGETPNISPDRSSMSGEAVPRVPSLPESEIATGTENLPVTTQQIRVLGSVLRPTDSDATYSSSLSGGCLYATASPITFFNTFLSLPHGATLTQARFYFNDTSGDDSFALITVLDYQGDVVTEWRLDTWGDTGSGYYTVQDINHVIDMENYSYIVRWRPQVTGSVMQACGFRLWFEVPGIFTDGFESGDTSQWSTTVP